MPCSVESGEFYFVGIYVHTLFQPPFSLTTIFHKHPLFISSAAIAGVIDLLKPQGSFALSIQYALCLAMPGSTVQAGPNAPYPAIDECKEVGKTFKNILEHLLNKATEAENSLEGISSSNNKRNNLALMAIESLSKKLTDLLRVDYMGLETHSQATKFVSVNKEETNLTKFVHAITHTFFDNDFLQLM